MVPVDIAHHHVLGEHEAFKGGYSFFGDGEPFPFGVGDEGFNEPLNVDAAVGDVAVVRVAHQVVHFVGIERAADEFAEARFVVTLDERYDAFGRYFPIVAENFGNGRYSWMLLVNKVVAEIFVVRKDRFPSRHGDLFFNNVGVGVVANVVQEACRQEHPAVVVVEAEWSVLQAYGERVGQHSLQNELHEVVDPD